MALPDLSGPVRRAIADYERDPYGTTIPVQMPGWVAFQYRVPLTQLYVPATARDDILRAIIREQPTLRDLLRPHNAFIYMEDDGRLVIIFDDDV